MTKKQQWLYWREWGAVRKALLEREGWEGKAADEFRHTLHLRALGRQKSSKALTNRDLDKVLAAFRAVSNPADVGAQVRQLEQGKVRAAHTLRRLVDELDLDAAYVDAIALKICKRRVIEFAEADFPKLIAALELHKARQLAAASQNEGAPF